MLIWNCQFLSPESPKSEIQGTDTTDTMKHISLRSDIFSSKEDREQSGNTSGFRLSI